MDKYSLYVPNFVPAGEYFDAKHNQTCIGCGVSLAVRIVGKAAENILGKANCERGTGSALFGCTTDAAILKIKQGKKEVIICLDDEPESSLQQAVQKNMPAVAIAEGVKYVATACPSYPFDLFEKTKRALDTDGNAYIHILCPCPSVWQYATEDTVKVGFSAVESRAFPLYEVGSGYYNMTIKTLNPRPVSEYIRLQGRFSSVTDKDIKAAQSTVEKEYKKLIENIQPAE